MCVEPKVIETRPMYELCTRRLFEDEGPCMRNPNELMMMCGIK